MIRKLKKEDIETVSNICKVSGATYDAESEIKLMFECLRKNLEYYVYEEDNIIKGVGGLEGCLFDDEVFCLLTCYILPEYQSKGIGKKLVEFRLNRIKELGGTTILASTQKRWHLERFGFTTNKYEGSDWYLMQLNIV